VPTLAWTHLAMRTSNKCEYFLLKRMGKTISDYKLIENNDRIMVAVSELGVFQWKVSLNSSTGKRRSL